MGRWQRTAGLTLITLTLALALALTLMGRHHRARADARCRRDSARGGSQRARAADRLRRVPHVTVA